MDDRDRRLLISLAQVLGKVMISCAQAVVVSHTAADRRAGHSSLDRARGQLKGGVEAAEIVADGEDE